MLKKYCILFFILISQSVFADVKAFIDRSNIHANETFTLTIQLNSNSTAQPDLSVLPDELVIRSSTSFHHSSYINGQATTELGWKVQLVAYEPGVFTIPAIKVGSESSAPFQIKVEPSSNTLKIDNENDSAIILKAEVDKKSVYVQEHVLLTVKLYRAVLTQYASLTEPKMNDVLVEKVGEDTVYESIINGKRYRILERKYALFPQKSGELEIPTLVFNADMVSGSSSSYSPFGRLMGRSKPVSVSTEPMKIEIKPYPNNHTGLWLPSEKVSLSAHWTSNKEKVVGEPSTWSLRLTGVGLHENQLPEIEIPNVDGVKWYPDAAEKTRSISDKGLVGERIARVAVVPTREGKIKLPQVSVRWFNTKTEQYEVASLSPEIIDVKPNPETVAQQNLNQQNTALSPNSDFNGTRQETNGLNTTNPAGVAPNNLIMWQWISVLFAALWLSTLFYAWYLRQHQTELPYEKSLVQSSQPASSRIKQACNNKNSSEVYRELSQWFIKQCPQENTLRYSDYCHRINDQTIRDSLLRLERSLFAPNGQQWQEFDQLIKWLPSIQRDLQKTHRKADSVLAPLYPN